MARGFDSDIVITGGGLSGATAALALASAGFSVTVIDALAPRDAAADAFDGRVTAIAAGSRRMFGALGVWAALEEDAQPINEILVTDGRVSEGAGSAFLHFDHRETGRGVFGHMVENRHLRRALFARLEAEPRIDWRAPARVEAMAYDGAAATATLEDGTTIRAPLALGCDGRPSRTARAAGIRFVEWTYRQTGIVCTVEHERPHEGIAHEYFLPAGPFAILPMTGNRASLVWTERPDVARDALALDEAGFGWQVRRRFGAFLGETRVVGPRWSYPLSFSLARSCTAPRLALVGDAAHAVHPIAGQGFNLGMRDIAALAEVLAEAARAGEDIGGADILDRYARWRRFDNTVMALGMDAMNRLFSNDITPVRLLRDAGIGLVNAIGPARRFFMAQAAGETGDLPRLLRGQAV